MLQVFQVWALGRFRAEGFGQSCFELFLREPQRLSVRVGSYMRTNEVPTRSSIAVLKMWTGASSSRSNQMLWYPEAIYPNRSCS